MTRRQYYILSQLNNGKTLREVGEELDLTAQRVKSEWEKAITAIRAARPAAAENPSVAVESGEGKMIITKRLENLLLMNGVSLEEAQEMPEGDFLSLRNAGPKSLQELRGL